MIVTCRQKVTSPIAEEVGMQPNAECRIRFEVGPFPKGAEVALVRCPRGHQFHIDLRRRK